MKIALFGVNGRMGREITRIVASEPAFSDLQVSYGVVSRPDGEPASDGKTVLTNQPETISSGVDVIIDFSSSAGCRAAVDLARRLKKPILVGTTGLSTADEQHVKELASAVPVVRSTNTSIVVTAMLELVGKAAQLLGPAFDVELVEIHHRMKKDAPSGTALSLLEEVSAVTGTDFENTLHLGRAGTDALRRKGEMGAYGVRGGDVAGEHTVYFLGDGERLEITQRATSRAVFARGALIAARWLCGFDRNGAASGSSRSPGLFTMRDVLHG